MINSFTPPSDGNEAPKSAPEPLGGALYGHAGAVAGELGGLMKPSFSTLRDGPGREAAAAPALPAAPVLIKPSRRSRGRPLLVAGFAFAALAVASAAVLLRPSAPNGSSDGFTAALKVKVDAAGSRSGQMAALAYAPAPHLAPPSQSSSPAAEPDASQIGVLANAPASPGEAVRRADGLRRIPPLDSAAGGAPERRPRFALVAPEPRWLDRLADSDKPPLRPDSPPRAAEAPPAEPGREGPPRAAAPPERRAAEPEAAGVRARAAPAVRGVECGPETDCPSYQAVMAADGKLRRAYAEAVEAGVPQYVLLTLRRDWSDLRSGRAGQPADLVRGYERVAYELWRARQTALQRRETPGGWDDPDRRGDYR